MIRQTASILLLAALFVSGSALAGPPTDEQIEAAIAAYNEGIAAGAASREDYVRIATEALEGIDVSKMSARQVGRLMSHGPLLSFSGQMNAANDRLRDFLHDTGVDGAIANVLLLNLEMRAADDDEARLDVYRRAVNHPALDEAVRSGAINMPFRRLSGIPANLAPEVKKEILSLERFLTPELATEVAGDFIAYFELLNRVAEDQPETIARLRERMATLAAAAAQTVPEAQARGIRNAAAYLDGAFARGELVGHKAPPLTITWSSDPAITSLDDLKGKVVVLDFWATWCGPCVASFPNVRKLVEHYQGYPVVVLGVTSLQGSHTDSEAEERRIDTTGDPDKEYALMASYIETRNLIWPVVFTEENVFNPDYGVRGIPHVAIIDAEGKVRHRGLHPSRPLAQKAALIDDLLKEANLPAPPAPEEG